MSKLADYSKFDHIDDGSSDDEDQGTKAAPVTPNSQAINEARQQQQPSSSTAPATTNQSIPHPPSPAAVQAPPTITGPSMRKNQQTGRYIYEFNGRPVYEWEQKLEDVTIYLPAPPVTSQQIHCQIFPQRLELGVKDLVQQQGKYFLKEETFGLVDVSESTWYLDDASTLIIYLAKAKKGEVWDVALRGNTGSKNPGGNNDNATTAVELDPMSKQEIQKEMMLERFQEENPGMDFRGAEFNGSGACLSSDRWCCCCCCAIAIYTSYAVGCRKASYCCLTNLLYFLPNVYSAKSQKFHGWCQVFLTQQ